MRQEAKIIPHPAVRRASEHLLHMSPMARSPYSAVILLLFVELLVAVTVFAVHRDAGLAIVRENGPVETGTVVFYAAAGLMMVMAGRRGAGLTAYLSAFMMLALGLRELDFHYRFTARGIDQLYFYTDEAIPLTAKIVVVAILAVIAGVLGVLAVRGIGVLGAARRGAPYAITALAAIVLLPVSPLLDQAHYHITEVQGRAADSGLAFAIIVLEETLELLIPALFLIATVQWIRDREPAAKR